MVMFWTALEQNPFCRSERVLTKMEQEHNVNRRWEPSDSEYKEAKHGAVAEKQKQLSVAMWTTVVKRHLLLRLKAKYAGK